MTTFAWHLNAVKTECSPFALQKGSFYTPKGLLLQPKRTPFTTQKDSF